MSGLLDLTATIPAGATAVLDKQVADIQAGVTLEGDVIRGTSKHVADWSSAGFDPDEGTNFVCIHLKGGTGVSLTCECVPSQGSPTASFTDDDVVLQITPETTGILVKATKGGATTQASFDLDMELEDE